MFPAVSAETSAFTGSSQPRLASCNSATMEANTIGRNVSHCTPGRSVAVYRMAIAEPDAGSPCTMSPLRVRTSVISSDGPPRTSIVSVRTSAVAQPDSVR